MKPGSRSDRRAKPGRHGAASAQLPDPTPPQARATAGTHARPKGRSHAHAHAHAHAHGLGHAHPDPAHRHGPGLRLPRWQRWWLDASGAALLLTGLLWLAWHYRPGQGADELPHPLAAWLLRGHGLAAYAALFALGLVAAAHVPQGWRLSRRAPHAGQRGSGLGLCVMAGALALSGYGLYYFSPEWLRPGLGWGHALVGVGLAVTLLWHRRGAQRRAAHRTG